jgi:hypothetical protein
MDPVSITNSFHMLASAPEAMLNAAMGKTGSLLRIGNILLTIAFLAELATLAFGYWMKGSLGDMLGGFLRLSVITAVPLAMLNEWQSAGTLISRLFQHDIAGAFGGTTPMDMIDTVLRVVDDFWKDLSAQMLVVKHEATPTQTGHSFMDKVRAVGDALTPDVLSGLVSMIAKLLAAIVFIIFVAIPAAIFALVMLITLYGTQLLTVVGVCFGPIMICWLPWKPMSWTFMSWVKHMIQMGVTYAVAVLIASIASVGITTVGASLHNTGDGISGILGVYTLVLPACLMLGVMLLYMAHLVNQSNHIASGIVGGGGSGHGGGSGLVVAAAMAASKLKGGGKGKPSPPPPPPPK